MIRSIPPLPPIKGFVPVGAPLLYSRVAPFPHYIVKQVAFLQNLWFEKCRCYLSALSQHNVCWPYWQHHGSICRMLVKSLTVEDHIRNLGIIFQVILFHGMRSAYLRGKFVGYVVRHPFQAWKEAIIDMKSPTTRNEVQCLTGSRWLALSLASQISVLLSLTVELLRSSP